MSDSNTAIPIRRNRSGTHDAFITFVFNNGECRALFSKSHFRKNNRKTALYQSTAILDLNWSSRGFDQGSLLEVSQARTPEWIANPDSTAIWSTIVEIAQQFLLPGDTSIELFESLYEMLAKDVLTVSDIIRILACTGVLDQSAYVQCLHSSEHEGFHEPILQQGGKLSCSHIVSTTRTDQIREIKQLLQVNQIRSSYLAFV